MNVIFLALIVLAFLVAAIRETGCPGDHAGPDRGYTLEATKGAVSLALGLVGVMALFMGLLNIIARMQHPLVRRLFPEAPPDHSAMEAMILNLPANMLGLGNAATHFGLRAIQHLETLNRHKGTASNTMVLFPAINTASVTVLPTSVIALRAGLGSANPAAVVAPTLIATLYSFMIAVVAARGLAPLFPLSPAGEEAPGRPGLKGCPDDACPGPGNIGAEAAFARDRAIRPRWAWC